MKSSLYITGAAFAAALAITSLSPAFVSPASAEGDGGCLSGCEPTPTTKGNNGFGQEKQGAPQDGENPGSDNGNQKNRDSKRNGSGLR